MSAISLGWGARGVGEHLYAPLPLVSQIVPNSHLLSQCFTGNVFHVACHTMAYKGSLSVAQELLRPVFDK